MLITFATLAEARATLQACHAKQIGPHLFQDGKRYILITGMGYCRTMVRLGDLPFRPESILNLGVAGALDPEWSLYTCLSIRRVELYAPKANDEGAKRIHQNAFPLITLDSKGIAELITTPMPIHGGDLYNSVNGSKKLVDMEGYGIAFTAQEWGIPCTIIKIVSDFGKENASAEIQKNLEICSKKLSEELLTTQ
mgnify:CR=1 FL=1